MAVALLGAASCTADAPSAPSPTPTTSAPAPISPGASSTQPSFPPAPSVSPVARPPLPQSQVGACTGPPPFRMTYLPPGYSARVYRYNEGRTLPPGYDENPEPYDPTFELRGRGSARLYLYHGNAWRLALALRKSFFVNNRPAWESDLGDTGRRHVDIRWEPKRDACAYWGFHGASGAELRKILDGLRPT